MKGLNTRIERGVVVQRLSERIGWWMRDSPRRARVLYAWWAFRGWLGRDNDYDGAILLFFLGVLATFGTLCYLDGLGYLP